MSTTQRTPLLLYPAFLLSGWAALSYEMAWVRQLVMLFGVSYFAITTILTVFMAGLACGAWFAGRIVDRGRVPPLLAFAGLELFLGVYAQLFDPLLGLVDRAYLALAADVDLGFGTHAALRFLFAALILAPPTLASGATLPAAAKAFVREEAGFDQSLAGIYGANVIGAALGCLCTTFWTIGLWGYPVTAVLGTAANLIAAGLAWAARTPETPVRPPEAVWQRGAGLVGAAYFSVGFVVVGSEVLWTRVLAQSGFNPATYVFGLVLVSFLVGHALGAGVLYRWLSARWAPGLLFPALQAAIGLGLLLGVLALVPRFEAMVPVLWLRQMGVVLPWQRLWILLPGVVLPAACSGALFPLAARIGLRGLDGLGTGVGTLGALSTLGGIAGSFLVGFWAMPAFGAVHVLIVLAGLCGVTAAVSTARLFEWPVARARALGGGAVMAAALLLVLIDRASLLVLFPGEVLVAFAEGRNSSTAVLDHPSGYRFMLVGGERLLGGGSDVNLAVSMHPQARSAAVIGVGTGSVTASALYGEQLTSVTAIDVDGDIPRFFPYMQERNLALFTPPRFRFVENDGRHFLRTWPDTFDIIVNDAAIYAWYLELSTLEFNRLARSRLGPEGLYVGRLHLWRITEGAFASELKTFLEVFPNAAIWKLADDIAMLVGRNGHMPVDRTVPTSLPAAGGTTLWMDAAAMRESALRGRLITDSRPLHVPDTFLMRDLYPIIEYTSPGDLPADPHGAAPSAPPPPPATSTPSLP